MKQLLLLATLVAAFPISHASTCYGTVSNGRLEHGVQMPARGSNFRAYSAAGIALGRTWLHARVRAVVLDAYASLARISPDKVFVYGETGLAAGGRFAPHRTHQSGLSVDFMVPVLDAAGRSVPLPATAFNNFGYAIEFDQSGRAGELRIDFDAMAEHLHQLRIAARRYGVGINLLIFDPALAQKLLRTTKGASLEGVLPLMKRPPWIRHDEHYHIDFTVPCRPLATGVTEGAAASR
jgi:penicillin-insensitive murein endopeptidase